EAARADADADRESGPRVDPGRRAPGRRRLALLRPQAGPGASLLHGQPGSVQRVQGRTRLLVISGRTRLIALLGQPVAESLSPRMQNAAFAAAGLDWAHVACEVARERLGEGVRGLAALGFAGANATIPHKHAVAGLEALVRQGAASFELWTGRPAPMEAMRAAVRSA